MVVPTCAFCAVVLKCAIKWRFSPTIDFASSVQILTHCFQLLLVFSHVQVNCIENNFSCIMGVHISISSSTLFLHTVSVAWDVVPSNLANSGRRFRGDCRLSRNKRFKWLWIWCRDGFIWWEMTHYLILKLYMWFHVTCMFSTFRSQQMLIATIMLS